MWVHLSWDLILDIVTVLGSSGHTDDSYDGRRFSLVIGPKVVVFFKKG